VVDSLYDLEVSPLMPLLLYTLTAAALLWLAHRFVRPLSRWAALVLFLLPFTFAGYALLTSRVMAPVDLAYQTVPLSWMKPDLGVEEISPGFHSDVYTEFVPWRRAVQRSLANGEWGLRDPFALSGDILLASQQAAVYWPLTLIACLMPAALSFTYTAAMTMLIAALCAFLFARELACGEPAAMIAAAGWSLATAMLAFLMVTMSATWAWCPLLLLAVQRVCWSAAALLPLSQRAERASGASESGGRAAALHPGALLTVAFTALLYSAHPESAVLSILLGLLYAGFCVAQKRRDRLRPVITAAAAGIVALLLSAIHLLPFLEALPQSMEHAHRMTEPAPQPAQASESLARIATSFFPYLHARKWSPGIEWFDTGIVGSVIFALAIFAVIRVRSATTWFFAALAVFSLLGHAKWPPLVLVLQKVPVLSIALTDRLSFGMALSLCVLAALGVQHLTRRAAWVMGALLIALSIGNWWAVHTPRVEHAVRRSGDFAIAAELIGLAMAMAIILWKPRFTPALLLGLVIAQRAVSEHGIYKSFDLKQAYPRIPIFEAMKSAERPFRITGHGNALIPQTATMYQLEDVRGFSALTFHRYFETYPLWSIHQPVFYNRVDDLTRPFLSFLNVRYAITWDRDPPPRGWREVARQKGTMLFENTNALDRAFVPPRVRFGPLTEILQSTDFATQAWIEADLPPGERQNGPGTVTIRDAHLGYVIDADMQGDGWIVTSITAWKGWRAYIDGRRVKTQFANHAFLGVHVPKGTHKVELRYWPESFVIGRAITAATLLAAAIAMVLLHRRQQAVGSRP
jgi:Bacterial membrane protein YfhO